MGLPVINDEIIEAYCDAGLWQRRRFYQMIDEFAAQTPDKLAIADQTRRLTYAELAAAGNALARFLLESGVRAGESVAVQAGSSADLFIGHVACNRAGFIFIPMSIAWGRRELQHLLTLSRTAALVTPIATPQHDYLSAALQIRSEHGTPRLIGTTNGQGADFALNSVISSAGKPVDGATDPNVPSFVMTTSGTTNFPKLSLWTDNNLYYFMKCFAEATQMDAYDVAVGFAPAGTGSIGYIYPGLFPLMAGASSVLLEHWEPRAAVALLASEGATMASGVPTQMIKMLEVPDVAQANLRLRAFSTGGAALPPSVVARFEDVLRCRVQTNYGASDGGIPVMTRIDDPPAKRYETVGRALAMAQVEVVDHALHPLAVGDAGEVIWRSPSKSFGYLNEDDRTAEVWLDEGWYRSGDMGELDGDGYLRIVGRLKDLVIRGGQNISPREIEEAIGKHASVAEVAIVGYPDPVYGERVCAVVSPRDGCTLTLDEVKKFLLDLGLASFKAPERLELCEELPKNVNGKFDKVRLRNWVTHGGVLNSAKR